MMKKIVGIVVMLVTCLNGIAQTTDAKAILDKMSETYKAMPGFEVSFEQKVKNESEVSDTFSGNVAVSKEKFLLKLSSQHIYCNGPVIWTYLVEPKELTIANFDPEDGFINPANVYDIYKEGFTYKYLRSDNNSGELVDVIELTSTDEDSDYTSVIMYIGQKDGYLKAWDMVDYDDITTAFQVTAFKPNVNFAEGHFEFDESKHEVSHKEDFRNQ